MISATNDFPAGHPGAGFIEAKNRETPKEVEPQSFFGITFECQEKAASIRNRVVEAIDRDDKKAVSVHYVRNRTLLNNQYLKAGLSWIFTVASVAVVLYALPLLISCAVVTSRNVIRCQETQNTALDYLQKKMSDREIQVLNNMPSSCKL
ncbi:hypothetical protein [Endozoicomonas sp.]|uniref:hypothetical protein n=1 Tax=Endozoicomonas sp. TaxID=1892382 RepID=UPI003AF7497B